MGLEDELVKFIDGQIAALGWEGGRDYAARCLIFWRTEYGDTVADRAASSIRQNLRARRPKHDKARHGRGAEAVVSESEQGGGSEARDESPDPPAELEG